MLDEIHLPDGEPLPDVTLDGKELLDGFCVTRVRCVDDEGRRIEAGEGIDQVGKSGDIELAGRDLVTVLSAQVPIMCEQLLFLGDRADVPAAIITNAVLDTIAVGTRGRQLVALATVARFIVTHLCLGTTESLGGATETEG